MAGARGAAAISALVILSATGVLNGVILAGPRTYFAMADEGLAFAWMGKIHPRFHTPSRAIALQAVWSCALVGTMTYGALFKRVVYTEWLFFALMAVGLYRLRARPGYQPVFREGRGEKCGIVDQASQRVPVFSFAFGRIELAERRLRKQQQQQRQQHSGRSSSIKWSSPTVLWTHDSAQQISQRGSDRKREIKHPHDPPTFLNRKQVCDKGWRKNDKAGFADAHQGVTNEQLVKVCRDGGEQSGPTPHQSPGNDDALAREAQRKRPHEGGRAHIKNEEDAGEQAEGRVAAMELRFNQILYREQHGAIDVIEQVQRREERQCRARIEFRRGHRSSEYSMKQKRNTRPAAY